VGQYRIQYCSGKWDSPILVKGDIPFIQKEEKMIHENKIQDIPVSDSPNNDAFEAIVELYYQLNGFTNIKW